MRERYPHESIWINGRTVSIKDIVHRQVVLHTDFEKSVLNFISEWLNGVHEFAMKTSGSTGKPKTIVISREQMKASALLTIGYLHLQDSYNALTCLDAHYIAGKMMLVRSLLSGMRIIVVDPCSNPLIKVPDDMVIHFAAFVPLQVKTILESNHPHLLDGLTSFLIGGAALDSETIEKLQRLSSRAYATYGMTETISHVALQPLNGSGRSDLFETFSSITVRTDSRSCLVIAAPYLDDEVVTNDIVELVDEKFFRWVGRYDNVINTCGIKVSPEDLERRIGKIFTRLKFDAPFFISGIPDKRLGEKIVLVVEWRSDDTSALQNVKEMLLHSFSAFEKPKEILISPSFVYTDTMKINRSESVKTAHPLQA